ncbi:MAG TPA: rhodanese-like domain-containing protein, partial [Cyclobacteriaceae bacterium]|nr:rhodanese-like domain-containing protein [Cyclobacteriaceae bacterium]
RAAKIGYEKMIRGALLNPDYGTEKSPTLDLRDFRTNPGKYTVVDVRNLSETRNNMVFSHAIKIPLYELRERAGEIPTDKPIVVHCAGGYRSAAAASIINKKTGVVPCFDLGENIKQFRAGVTSSFE